MEKSNITMEDIMGSTLDEVSSEIRAVFKKTIYIKAYETEVIELESKIKIEENISSAERMILSAMLQIQLEYDAYCQLVFKGYVTSTEFNDRKKNLIESFNALKNKLESSTGIDVHKYFK